jgi:hypothetical protein
MKGSLIAIWCFLQFVMTLSDDLTHLHIRSQKKALWKLQLAIVACIRLCLILRHGSIYTTHPWRLYLLILECPFPALGSLDFDTCRYLNAVHIHILGCPRLIHTNIDLSKILYSPFNSFLFPSGTVVDLTNTRINYPWHNTDWNTWLISIPSNLIFKESWGATDTSPLQFLFSKCMAQVTQCPKGSTWFIFIILSSPKQI